MYINNKKVGVFFMLSKQVLNLLKVTRPTLTKFVNEGKIKVEVLENGFYNYNDEDAYRILSDGIRIRAGVGVNNKELVDFDYGTVENIMSDLLMYRIKNLYINKKLVDNTLILLCEKIGTQLEVI